MKTQIQKSSTSKSIANFQNATIKKEQLKQIKGGIGVEEVVGG